MICLFLWNISKQSTLFLGFKEYLLAITSKQGKYTAVKKLWFRNYKQILRLTKKGKDGLKKLWGADSIFKKTVANRLVSSQFDSIYCWRCSQANWIFRNITCKRGL